MPFTPFHAGPAFILKIVRPKWISLPLFGIANVAIDMEVLVHRGLMNDSGGHHELHSFVGASVVALILCLIHPILIYPMRIWNRIWKCAPGSFICMETTLRRRVVVTSLLGGAWSHSLMDAISHRDGNPLWPFFASNPMQIVSNAEMHAITITLCVLTGTYLLWQSKRN